MSPSELLEVAVSLSEHPAPGKLKQVYRRRAISTAYYALFHRLAGMCADTLVGARKSQTPAWQRTYRALEHGFAKSALLELARRSNNDAVTLLSEVFVALQQFRHEADYDPHGVYEDGASGSCITMARLGIEAVSGLSPEVKLEIATSLILRSRR